MNHILLGDYIEFKTNSIKRSLKQNKLKNLKFKVSNYILFTSNTKLLVKSGDNFSHRIFSRF